MEKVEYILGLEDDSAEEIVANLIKESSLNKDEKMVLLKYYQSLRYVAREFLKDIDTNSLTVSHEDGKGACSIEVLGLKEENTFKLARALEDLAKIATQ